MSTLPAPFIQPVDAVFDYRSRSATKEVGPINEATHSGNYVCMLIVETAVDLSDAQLDSLKAQIEDITGVQNAYPMLGPAALPFDDLPTGYDLYVRVTGEFLAKETA